MAQRKSATSKKYAGRDVVVVTLSTGYRLIIERLTLGEIEALNRKAEELFPAPPRPTERVTLATGDEQDVPLGAEHPLVQQWQEKLEETKNKQGEYLLQYALNEITDVEGYEGDEGHARLIAEFKPRMERLQRFGSLSPSVADNFTPYAQIIRLFLIADAPDFQAVMEAVVSAATAEVDEGIVKSKIKFFRG